MSGAEHIQLAALLLQEGYETEAKIVLRASSEEKTAAKPDKAQMANMLRKIANDLQEATAKFESFAFKRVEVGDLNSLATSAHAAVTHNTIALRQIAEMLEKSDF